MAPKLWELYRFKMGTSGDHFKGVFWVSEVSQSTVIGELKMSHAATQICPREEHFRQSQMKSLFQDILPL